MKFVLKLILVTISFFSCSKEKAYEDVSEGQVNWKKIKFDNIYSGGDPFSWLRINSISFIDEQTGYMCGSYCYHEPVGIIYKTTDAGNSWVINDRISCGAGSICESINFLTPSNGIVGYSCLGLRAQQTLDAAQTWNGLFIDMLNPEAAYKINSSIFIIGNKTTKNGGATWNTIDPLVNTNSYYFKDTSFGLSVTSNGIIGRTIDFGLSWDTLFNNISINLKSVQIPQVNTIIVGGDNIMKSSDGGANWSISYEGLFVNDIKFINSSIGFAATSNNGASSSNQVKGQILKTIDGGTTWSVNYSSKMMGFSCLSIINENTIIAGSNLNAPTALNSGYIIKTTTQGN